MKKTKTILTVVFFVFVTSVDAQDYQSTLTFNAGFSLVGGLFDIPDVNANDGDVSSYSIPALQVGYDYYLNHWFSLGAAGSVQFMGVNYDEYYYNSTETVEGSLNITRINIAARALFHYVNKDRLDLYSGLRMGFTNWLVTEDLTDETYNYDEILTFNSGINYAPQLILFGVRGYFTDNFGANMELAVGAPHFFSIGLNYRF